MQTWKDKISNPDMQVRGEGMDKRKARSPETVKRR